MGIETKHPIEQFIERQGVIFLDGGLATELEAQGWNLNHRLWSARILMTHPEAIQEVHLNYLKAGADCIISSNYQATVAGFVSEGANEHEAKKLLKKSIDLAGAAREQFLTEFPNQTNRALPPMVAASIGPYGAYLADGSEFVGNYGIPFEKLKAFHESRWELLSETSNDLFACETIPSFSEARVLLQLFEQTPEQKGWISFSCSDGEHICDGTPISECAAAIEESDQVVAVGVNCTAPNLIPSLINRIRNNAPSKRIVVYPNSGESYDGQLKQWSGHATALDFGRAAVEWKRQGASILGGCCRTGPAHIEMMRRTVLGSP